MARSLLNTTLDQLETIAYDELKLQPGTLTPETAEKAVDLMLARAGLTPNQRLRLLDQAKRRRAKMRG